MAARERGTVLVRAGAFSVLFSARSLLVCGALAVVAAGAVVVSVIVGSSRVGVGEAVEALLGYGDHRTLLLVRELRLPRVVVGLLVGAAFGVAGCLTQTLSRNRLATPDFVGVSDGALAVVLAGMLAAGVSTIGAWWAGPLGAAATAALVVLVAGGLGTRGYRVLAVGLAVSTAVQAVTDLVLSQQQVQLAGAVFAWSVGSLGGRGYAALGPLLAGLLVLLPLAMLVARKLAVLQLDDDVATSLGVPVTKVRLAALAVAVLLAGLAVGVSGPVGFVALAAPVVASRLTAPGRVPVVGSALLGGVLLTVADTVGRVAGGVVEVPVGVVTGLVGGPFLLWVLLRDRSGREF